MIASSLAKRSEGRINKKADSPVPYCFILDDEYKVVLAGPSGTADPLAGRYSVGDPTDALPERIDGVVRSLTATWRVMRPSATAAALVATWSVTHGKAGSPALVAVWRVTRPSTCASACVDGLQVSVAPLHGYDGRRMAVFVQRAAEVSA